MKSGSKRAAGNLRKKRIGGKSVNMWEPQSSGGNGGGSQELGVVDSTQWNQQFLPASTGVSLIWDTRQSCPVGQIRLNVLYV